MIWWSPRTATGWIGHTQSITQSSSLHFFCLTTTIAAATVAAKVVAAETCNGSSSNSNSNQQRHHHQSSWAPLRVVGDVRFVFFDVNQLSLPTAFYSALCIYFCLNGPFNCISFLKFSFSPDVIPSGWLGSKHQTNQPPSSTTTATKQL